MNCLKAESINPGQSMIYIKCSGIIKEMLL